MVAPVALHIPYVQEKLRKDFKVAAQNAWVKGSGAYTGEIRCAFWRLLGVSEFYRTLLIAAQSWEACGPSEGWHMHL